MDNPTNATYIQLPINEKTATQDLSGDFTLPDYQPEIKRLLKVSAQVLPPQKYIGDSEGELSGGIDYYVHYIGSDNQIYCAPLSSDYKITVPMDKNELRLVNITADAEITPESVGGRVTSPRKLNIKCRLRAKARMYGDMPIDQSYMTEGGDNQTLYGRESITRRLFTQSEQIKLSDELIVPKDDETRVVCADGHVLIGESVASSNAFNVKGELYLKITMCRESDGSPYTMLRRLPFSEGVILEGASSDCEANAKGSVCELNISVEEDRIFIDVGILLEVSACKDENVVFVKDIYSTTHNTACTYRSLPTLKCGRAFNSNFTQSDSMTLEEAGLTPEHKIVDISGMACPESSEIEGDMWVFTGKTRFSMIAEKDGEYSSTEIELPYRYSVDARCDCKGEMFASASAEIINARARLDGERIGVDAEIMLCAVTSEMSKIEMLDAVEFGDELKSSRGEYVICYPSATDSLWSVARRYGKALTSLGAANKLALTDTPDSKETLKDVHFLVI